MNGYALGKLALPLIGEFFFKPCRKLELRNRVIGPCGVMSLYLILNNTNTVTTTTTRVSVAQPLFIRVTSLRCLFVPYGENAESHKRPLVSSSNWAFCFSRCKSLSNELSG